METVKRNLPELRYLYFYVKKTKRAEYVKYASSEFIETLWQIGLNLVFSNKNNIKLRKKDLTLLRKTRLGLKRLIRSESAKDRRSSLTNAVLDVLLSVFVPWIAKNKLA